MKWKSTDNKNHALTELYYNCLVRFYMKKITFPIQRYEKKYVV